MTISQVKRVRKRMRRDLKAKRAFVNRKVEVKVKKK